MTAPLDLAVTAESSPQPDRDGGAEPQEAAVTAETETTTTTEEATTETETETQQPAGDLAAMERALRKANKEAEQARLKLKEREDADLSETERAQSAAKEAESKAAAAVSKANDRILRAEVKALATGKLASPALAAGLLNLGDFTVDDNGDVDTKAIEKALDALIAAHPELAGAGPNVPRVQGGPRTPGGPGGTQPSGMNGAIAAAFGRR